MGTAATVMLPTMPVLPLLLLLLLPKPALRVGICSHAELLLLLLSMSSVLLMLPACCCGLLLSAAQSSSSMHTAANGSLRSRLLTCGTCKASYSHSWC
jgi:hypothetical protein